MRRVSGPASPFDGDDAPSNYDNTRTGGFVPKKNHFLIDKLRRLGYIAVLPGGDVRRTAKRQAGSTGFEVPPKMWTMGA